MLPVCARCTGIYTGVFFAVIFFLLNKRLKGNRPFSTANILFGALAFLPISIDGFFSYLGFWQSNGFLRIITGLLAGVSLPAFFLFGANFRPEEENLLPIFKSVKEQVCLALFALIWGVLLWRGIGFYGLSALIITMGILFFWMGLFYMILKNIVSQKKFPFWRLAFGCAFFIIIGMGILAGIK